MATTIVTLPTTPPPLTATLALVSKSTEMSGPLGGPTQRVLRVGSRFKVDFQLPPMPYNIGRQWLARFISGEANPVALRFPQRGLLPLNPGPVAVNGPQTGTVNTGGVLAIKGATPEFAFLSGQFFHINASVDGRRYLHQVRDDASAGADGTVTLAIQPPLRFVPADGDTLEFVNPMIEGFLTTGWNWTIEMARRVGLKGTITEDR